MFHCGVLGFDQSPGLTRLAVQRDCDCWLNGSVRMSECGVRSLHACPCTGVVCCVTVSSLMRGLYVLWRKIWLLAVVHGDLLCLDRPSVQGSNLGITLHGPWLPERWSIICLGRPLSQPPGPVSCLVTKSLFHMCFISCLLGCCTCSYWTCGCQLCSPLFVRGTVFIRLLAFS